MPITTRIRPCLWFDHQAEEAANHYVGIFRGSRIVAVTKYPSAGFEIHQRPEGSVMTVEFVLDGQPFTALNGGPHFVFNEAISLEVHCDSQEEIDYYWDRLSAGGDSRAQQCGWLKDRYGLAWQVVPAGMDRMLRDHTSPGANRAMAAMLQMKKIDMAAIERAYAGGS